MTVSSENYRSGPYDGNDVATSFAYNFKIFADTELEVVHTSTTGVETTLTLAIDYTVSGVGDDAGGNVSYPVTGDPLATGEKLTIKRKMPYKQETDLRNQGTFNLEEIEKMVDRAIMVTQQLKEVLDRVPRLTDASAYSGLTLPDPQDGYMLQWKTDLSGFKNVIQVPTSTYTVSAYGQTLIDDADATEARTTLGISAANTPVADAGGYFTAAEVESALAELYTSLLLGYNWIPSIQDSSQSDSESQTYNIQTGRAVKLGELYIATFAIEITSAGTMTAGDAIQIGGIDLVANMDLTDGIAPVGFITNATGLIVTAGTSLTLAAADASHLYIKNWDLTTGPSNLLISELNIGAAPKIEGVFMFRAA